MEEKIPSTIFETSSYKEKDRIDVYRESMGVFFSTANFGVPSKDFSAKMHSHLIKDLMLIKTETSSQQFSRSSAQIAKDSIDHYLIQLFLSGRTVDIKRPEEIHCHQDLLIVMDGSRPWNAFTSNFSNLTLVIPRRLLEARLINPNDQHGKVMNPAVNPFARILRNQILTLHEMVGNMKNNHAGTLSNLSVDMAAAALNFGEKDSSFGLAESNSLKAAIKSFIEKEIHQTELSINVIQKQFGLSRSTLYRLFPEAKGGLMTHIRNRRLERAYKNLCFNPKGAKTITSIAFEHGFENASSFTRAFKAKFGFPPSEVDFEKFKQNPDSDSFRLWESWFRSL